MEVLTHFCDENFHQGMTDLLNGRIAEYLKERLTEEKCRARMHVIHNPFLCPHNNLIFQEDRKASKVALADAISRAYKNKHADLSRKH